MGTFLNFQNDKIGAKKIMELNQEQLLKLIKLTGLNRTQFAKSIHISRPTLFRILRSKEPIEEKHLEMIKHKYELFILKNEKDIYK